MMEMTFVEILVACGKMFMITVEAAAKVAIFVCGLILCALAGMIILVIILKLFTKVLDVIFMLLKKVLPKEENKGMWS